MKSNRNISDLEKLSYDTFSYMIESGDIEKDDLLNLCDSSPILTEYCNRNDQLIFRKALARIYSITDTHRYTPREFLELFQFDTMNQFINQARSEDYRFGEKRRVNFMIPDQIIEEFAEELGVSFNTLFDTKVFREILDQHIFSEFVNKNRIELYANDDQTNLDADLPHSVGDINIIWEKSFETEQFPEPELKRFESGGHGNYIVNETGKIIKINDKLGIFTKEYSKVDTSWANSARRYPSVQDALEESRCIKTYTLDLEIFNEINKLEDDVRTYVILGIIVISDQLKRLKKELRERRYIVRLNEKYDVIEVYQLPRNSHEAKTHVKQIQQHEGETVITFAATPNTKGYLIGDKNSDERGVLKSFRLWNENEAEHVLKNRLNNRFYKVRSNQKIDIRSDTRYILVDTKWNTGIKICFIPLETPPVKD